MPTQLPNDSNEDLNSIQIQPQKQDKNQPQNKQQLNPNEKKNENSNNDPLNSTSNQEATGENVDQLVKQLNEKVVENTSHAWDDSMHDSRIKRVDSSSDAFLSMEGDLEKRKRILSSGKMKLYILIDGVSPFVLGLNILKNHHYLQIATQYYSELYDGKPPGPIFLFKAIHFANGDKWLYFKRRATLQVKFQFEVQLRTPIYEELQPCPESVILGKNPSKHHISCDEIIRVASLNRLMLVITDPWSPQYFMDVFWCTFDTFMDAKHVLTKFIERWFVPELLKDQYNYSTHQEIFYNTIVKKRVKHRIATLLHVFVCEHLWRFSDEMLITLEKFVETYMKSVYPIIAQKIIACIKTGDRRPPWELYKKITPTSTTKASTSISTVSSVSVQDLGEQLTLMDIYYYKKIHFTEMCNQAWSKPKYKHKAPNLLDHINFLNLVSNWVASIIVSEQNLNNRKNLIIRFIKTAEYLMSIRSYNMMMAIDSALSSGPVYRLTMTWDEIDENIMSKREPIVDLISSSENYKRFRAAMQHAYECGEPCVPYSGIYLRDLVFTDDGNPAFVDGKINFNKCVQTYNILDLVLRFQKRNYSFQPNMNIQSEIQSHQIFTKDELYELSLAIQGRGQR